MYLLPGSSTDRFSYENLSGLSLLSAIHVYLVWITQDLSFLHLYISMFSRLDQNQTPSPLFFSKVGSNMSSTISASVLLPHSYITPKLFVYYISNWYIYLCIPPKAFCPLEMFGRGLIAFLSLLWS